MTGMRKVGRNDPCPCGSGHKTKRCCGLQRGPDENSTARAFLAEVSRDAARLLNVSESQFIAMMEQWSGLAAIYPELRVRLPDNSPAIERLAHAYVEMDIHASRQPIHEVREEVDTPAERARLVRAVHALLSEGHVDVIAAAAAAYELSTDSRKLFSEWLMEALAIRMSELVAGTMLSEAHSDSAEHDRDAGSG
jgi:SEC-C motif